jgi:hypothetical protein
MTVAAEGNHNPPEIKIARGKEVYSGASSIP